MFGRKKQEEKRVSFDRGKQYPAMRCSICTGERVAGLKSFEGGEFEELMLIRSDEDFRSFRRMTGLRDGEEIQKFY